MANQEQLIILLLEGVEVWNQWRKDNPNIKINLTDANLSAAKFKNAKLQDANLARLQALGTNFNGATLTGACIEDWNINSETNFDNVICDYIYLKEGQQERRPHDPNKNFSRGEFARLFQQVGNTIELIFQHGINWKAFACAFYEENMQIFEKEEDEIFLREYQAVGNGLIVLKILIPPNGNKDQIKQDILFKYQRRIAELEEYLKAKKEILAPIYERLLLPRTQMTFNAPVTDVAGNVEGNQNIYASPEQQTLAEAAAEIQKLLKQLESSNPNATEADKVAYVNDETTPSFKRRVAAALKAGGETVIEEFLDNPYVNVGKAVVKAWIKPESNNTLRDR